MMLIGLCKLMVLAQLSLPSVVMHRVSPAPASITHVGAATQPAATQPAAAIRPNLLNTLESTTFGQLFSGRKTLSPQEAMKFQFWLNAIKDLLYTAVGLIPRIIIAVLFIGLFWLIHRGVRRVVLGSMARAHMDSSIRDMLGALLKWGIMGFGLVIACNQVGIQITALLTGVSIIGLAIGFAAQETLANFIAGIVIFWDKPFKVADWVDVDGKYGRVLRITFRSTRLLNRDGEVIVLPNTSMLAQKVTNHSTNTFTRINVPIGIEPRASIDAARAALLELTAKDSRILTDPRAAVVVTQCAPDAVSLALRFWIRDESVEKEMEEEYLEKSKNALDQVARAPSFSPEQSAEPALLRKAG
jgi:small conductance mechanosensitive channel